MARHKLNRKPLEEKILSYLERENLMKKFTDRDYIYADMNKTRREAEIKVSKMLNYELVDMCLMIDGRNERRNYYGY